MLTPVRGNIFNGYGMLPNAFKHKMTNKNLKQQISQSINIDPNHLNEISIEDVKFSLNTQLNINNIVVELMRLYDPGSISELLTASPDHRIPCRGYWVERTKDLVVHISVQKHSRTIVVPSDSWEIRDDVTIN